VELARQEERLVEVGIWILEIWERERERKKRKKHRSWIFTDFFFSLSLSCERIRISLQIQRKKERKKERNTFPPSFFAITFIYTFNSYIPLKEDAKNIMKALNKSLTDYKISYVQKGYVLTCVTHNNISFEIEICHLQETNTNGLRLKRLSGDTFAYKKLVSDVLTKLKV